jgi:hypothetical protein
MRRTVEPVAVLVYDLFPLISVADIVRSGNGVAQLVGRFVRGPGFNKSANTPDALLQFIVLKIVDGAVHHPKRGEAEAKEGGCEDQ